MSTLGALNLVFLARAPSRVDGMLLVFLLCCLEFFCMGCKHRIMVFTMISVVALRRCWRGRPQWECGRQYKAWAGTLKEPNHDDSDEGRARYQIGTEIEA
ncbi:hypothetical protein B0H19DRAFT_1140509 [Mycena capillaripes]|nr:hypothetical protein B0H19DRAFT_1140509 [Mycena capillaripes]